MVYTYKYINMTVANIFIRNVVCLFCICCNRAQQFAWNRISRPQGLLYRGRGEDPSTHECCFIQGVQEKLCFFITHCDPRDFQSPQRNASVQSLLEFFCTTNSSRLLARERWKTFENSWKKQTISNEHPVSICLSIYHLFHFYCRLNLCMYINIR